MNKILLKTIFQYYGLNWHSFIKDRTFGEIVKYKFIDGSSGTYNIRSKEITVKVNLGLRLPKKQYTEHEEKIKLLILDKERVEEFTGDLVYNIMKKTERLIEIETTWNALYLKKVTDETIVIINDLIKEIKQIYSDDKGLPKITLLNHCGHVIDLKPLGLTYEEFSNLVILKPVP